MSIPEPSTTRTRGWKYRVPISDIFYDKDAALEKKRDAVVERVRLSGWFRHAENSDMHLVSIVDGLASAEDEDEVKDFLHQLYDQADRDRAWLGL